MGLYFLYFQFCAVNAQDGFPVGQFVLAGKIEGKDTGIINLRYFDNEGKIVVTKTEIKKGRFYFSGSINGAADALLSIGAHPNLKSFEVFLAPNTINIKIKADESNAISVEGSATHKEFESIKRQQAPYEAEITVLLGELEKLKRNLQQNNASTDLIAQKAQLESRLNNLRTRSKDIERNFIRTNPSSFISPYLLSIHFERRELNTDSAEKLFNKFQPDVRNSCFGKRFLERLNGRKLSQTGMPALDFEMVDYNGNLFKLSSLKNNSVVLLDFWASWCIPCRQITPLLKDLHNKYKKQGLAIVGISWDFDKSSWKKAIIKDSANYWQQIYGFEPPNDGLRVMYSIPSIPMLVLINKAGVIVGRYNGVDTIMDLQRKLEEIFDNSSSQ